MKRHIAVLAAAALTPALALAGSRAAKGGAIHPSTRSPGQVTGIVQVTGGGVMHVAPEVVRLTLSYQKEGKPHNTVAQVLNVLQEDVRTGKAYIEKIVGKEGEVEVAPPTWSERQDPDSDERKFAGWSVVQNVAVSLEAPNVEELQRRLAALYDQDQTRATRPLHVAWDVYPQTRRAVEDQAAKLAVADAKYKAGARLPLGYSLGEITHISDGSRGSVDSYAARAGASALRGHEEGLSGPLIQAGKIAIYAAAALTFQLLWRPYRLIPSPDTHPARRGKKPEEGGLS